MSCKCLSWSPFSISRSKFLGKFRITVHFPKCFGCVYQVTRVSSLFASTLLNIKIYRVVKYPDIPSALITQMLANDKSVPTWILIKIPEVLKHIFFSLWIISQLSMIWLSGRKGNISVLRTIRMMLRDGSTDFSFPLPKWLVFFKKNYCMNVFKTEELEESLAMQVVKACSFCKGPWLVLGTKICWKPHVLQMKKKKKINKNINRTNFAFWFCCSSLPFVSNSCVTPLTI